MHFVARFQQHEHQLFRLDTRIYLQDCSSPEEDDPCVAAIVAKNPGSATPVELDQLTELALDGDKLLPTVRKRFVEAYDEADVSIPHQAFVRVWNLFYLCHPRLRDAITAFEAVSNPLWCHTEHAVPPIVWFAWGPPRRQLDAFKQRFASRQYIHTFYYDMDDEAVVTEPPPIEARVKHTQGMPRDPVHEHLVALISRQQ